MRLKSRRFSKPLKQPTRPVSHPMDVPTSITSLQEQLATTPSLTAPVVIDDDLGVPVAPLRVENPIEDALPLRVENNGPNVIPPTRSNLDPSPVASHNLP